MSFNRLMKVISIVIMLLILLTACKKDENDEEVIEKIEKDTSHMSLLEDYQLYYYLDTTDYTINWYDGNQQDNVYDIKKHLLYDVDLSQFNYEVEAIFNEYVWYRIIKDDIIYGFIKTAIHKEPMVEFYNYFEWEYKIRAEHYLMDPEDEIIIFDTVEIKEGESSYSEYVEEDLSSVLFYSELFSGKYIDNMILLFSGTDINYRYSHDEGLSYLLEKDAKLQKMDGSELTQKVVNLYDYTLYDPFIGVEDSELLPALEAKKEINTTNNYVIKALKNKEYEKIAKVVHEKKGLRLIPYDRMALEDAVLSKEYLAKYNDYTYNDIHYFGYMTASDTEMYMTLEDYYDYFMFPIDYTKTTAKYNDFSEDSEKFLLDESSVKYYHNPIIVQYQYEAIKTKEVNESGLNPLGEKSSSIKFIYEEIDGHWYLVAIMNNQIIY